MRPLFFLITLLLFSQCAGAQKAASKNRNYITKKTASGKAKKYYEKGMEYNVSGDNKKAIAEYEKALKTAPKFIDAQIQWSALKYYLKDFAAAEQGFEKVMTIDPAYSQKVPYVLALAEFELGKNDEGITHLKQYIASKPKNKTLLKKAENRLTTIGFTTKAMANPVPFKPESLGDLVNTQSPEYLPSLPADESVLIYTKRTRGQEDFYESRKIDSVWQAGVPLSDINTDLNEGAQSVSADGKFLVFTKCDNRKDGYGSCDIYFSEKRNGRWTTAANIGSPINSRDWESQPSLSADGKSIYFASKRSTGLGKNDLYLSQRDATGKWSKPQILSDIINTPGDDQSPFIHADGQTLYFMSNGHPGMGGFDLFYSRKQPDGSWGKPTNLGYPINTPADESTLVISLDGITAYYASDRDLFPDGTDRKQEKGTGMDLYSFELYEAARPQPVTYVRGKITDADSKKPLETRVEIMDMKTGEMHAVVDTDPDGTYLITLPVGKNYAFNVSKPAYIFHSEHFALEKKENPKDPFQLDIELRAIPEVVVAGNTEVLTYKPTILRNVFFDTGSADLRPESFTELNRLKQFLEEYPTVKIQLNGHTDNVGSDQDNLTLSDNRAKAVHTFLVENGIVATRMTYRGYGETTPIDTNETDIGRQANRRTEFVIVER